MLFKQWNEQSEPRHILDDKYQDTPSLIQKKELPTFNNFAKFFAKDGKKTSTLLIVPKRLHTLFINFNAAPLYEIIASYESQQYVFPIYSSNCISNSSQRNKNHSCNVLILDETVPVIVLNFFSKELAHHINSSSTIVIGLSDRISTFKTINSSSTERNSNQVFVPPEFVSNFAASLYFKNKDINYWLLPSEGPIGFEKVSSTNIDQLLQLITKFFDICDPSFQKTFIKNWNENDGTHVNTLYI